MRTFISVAAAGSRVSLMSVLARRKLRAGHMVLYPGTSLHRVLPVTRGARVASFFWIESVVADESERTLLFDLDQSVQHIAPAFAPDDQRLVQLTGVYHNLLRRWAKP